MKLKTTDTLEVVLAGAVTTNQCPLIAAYADVATDSTACAPSSTDGQTNSTTAVTWVASPATGFVRQIAYLSLYNADTTSVTVTVRINNGSTTRIVRKFTLLTGESFAYKDGNGFSVYDASGTPKSSAGLVNPMTTAGDLIVGGVAGAAGRLGIGSTGQRLAVVSGAPAWVTDADTWGVAVSDETTAITTGTAVVTLYAPYAGTFDEVFTGVSTQSSSGSVTVNVKKAGTTIFSTNPSIAASNDTSLSGGTPAVLSTTTFAKGDKLTIDITAAGTGAKGLKVYFRVHY